MQDGRVAHLAVDTFFTEVSKNDDIGHAIAAASTICRLGALALAFTKQKVIKQQMQSTVQVVRHG